MRRLILCAALAVLTSTLSLPAFAQVEVTNVSCSSSAETTGHVAWPADDPVWEFDVVRPGATGVGATPNGTGLEIRDVFYRGRKVMARGNTPVLNVEYDSGGCGCYRDWSDSQVNFVATNVVPGQTCLAMPSAGSVSSTCDTGTGGTPGSFSGVAFEDYGRELVISSHMSAGWYRYLMKWHFYEDGTIWPEYSFAAASATCTDRAHRHHVYWRFDFDIDGTPNDDDIFETAGLTSTPLVTEASRTWSGTGPQTYWSVRDRATGAGYDIVPSSEDLLLPIDNFSKTDALVLRYKASELTDSGGGCAINLGFMNNESVADQDVVFWYRSSALHTGGNPYECDIVGPTLRPVGFSVAGEAPPVAAAGIEIDAAVPNPFTPETTVRFRVAEAQSVRVVLYDALGRRVSTLFDGPIDAGRYETVRIESGNLPAGTYVVRVEGERAQATTRIVLQR
jgi:hypothetical protein